MRFCCVFSIKSSVFQQNYCISRINLCGHTRSPAGKLGGATDDNNGNKISNKERKRFYILSNKNSEYAAGTLFGHIALPSMHTNIVKLDWNSNPNNCCFNF